MTLTEIYDELALQGVQSDKNTIHSYLSVYEKLLAPYRKSIRVLEVGVFRGDSLRLWERFFDQAEVHGVDCSDQPVGGMVDLRPMIAEGTHLISIFDAYDNEQVQKHFGDKVFDVVIEDASHALIHQLGIYQNFKPLMAPDGIYIIEDIADIDTNRALFEQIDPEKDVRIIDRRSIKGRFDDVLVVIGPKSPGA